MMDYNAIIDRFQKVINYISWIITFVEWLMGEFEIATMLTIISVLLTITPSILKRWQEFYIEKGRNKPDGNTKEIIRISYWLVGLSLLFAILSDIFEINYGIMVIFVFFVVELFPCAITVMVYFAWFPNADGGRVIRHCFGAKIVQGIIIMIVGFAIGSASVFNIIISGIIMYSVVLAISKAILNMIEKYN